MNEKKDMVNHPPHYKMGGIETIDFIEAKGLGYNLGNVIKYVSRATRKNNYLEDLKKAEWYLKRAIKNAEKKTHEELNGMSKGDEKPLEETSTRHIL